MKCKDKRDVSPIAVFHSIELVMKSRDASVQQPKCINDCNIAMSGVALEE